MFNQFIIRLDVKPSTWEERLILFVGFLVQKGLKAATINSYISVIKAILKQDEVVISEDKYILNSMVHACRLHNNHVRIRLPIQKRLCTLIIKQTQSHFLQYNQPYLAYLYASLYGAAYYGMLRVGELTTGTHPVKVTDVRMGENKIQVLFILRSCKTHSADQRPQFIRLSSIPVADRQDDSNNMDHQWQLHFNLYLLINKYVQSRPKYCKPDEPFAGSQVTTQLSATHTP